jgi:lipoprotein-anchoring transpeptidase ErfK/SrfK
MRIDIDIQQQCLSLFDGDKKQHQWPISSAKNGVGEQQNSGCTPRGKHIIRAKIGEDCPPLTVFVGRRPTGEIFSAELAQQHPDRDWVLTRILWLSGTEVGKNRLGKVDSMQRYIYIHGCPPSEPMGTPLSHGCIRMRDEDLIQLFSLVPVKTPVYIHA